MFTEEEEQEIDNNYETMKAAKLEEVRVKNQQAKIANQTVKLNSEAKKDKDGFKRPAIKKIIKKAPPVEEKTQATPEQPANLQKVEEEKLQKETIV